MSYPTLNASDKADFFFSSGPSCGNCGRQGIRLTWIKEGDWMACDECAEEQERIETVRAADGSPCEERAAIVDDARRCAELVQRLKAHYVECALCASTRKTVQSDREYVNAAAVCCEVA